jgi:hypothetical protein
MSDTFCKSDARGSLRVNELEPGHLHVQVSGHLTLTIGEAFPANALEAAQRAERCTLYLDARELRGFDVRVRQSWLDVVLSERTRIERVIIATPGVFISARAASLALKPLGVHLDVVSNRRFRGADRFTWHRRRGRSRSLSYAFGGAETTASACSTKANVAQSAGGEAGVHERICWLCAMSVGHRWVEAFRGQRGHCWPTN